MARRRGLKKRDPDDYDNEVHGRPDSSTPFDDHSINTKLCRVNLMRPKGKEGPMILRPFPSLSYSNPEILVPGRKSTKPGGHHAWIVRVPMVSYAGLNDDTCDKVSFATAYPSWDKTRKQENPYQRLYNACKTADHTGKFRTGGSWRVEWNRFMDGDSKGGAEICKPTHKWFIQCGLLVNGERDYIDAEREQPLGLGEGDDLTIVQVSDACGRAIFKLFDMPKEDIDLDESEETETPWKAFLYGDPVGIYNEEEGTVKGGKFLVIFNPKHYKQITKKTSWNGTIRAAGQGYEAAVRNKVKGSNGRTYKPSLDAACTERVLDLWQFWYDSEPGAGDGLIRVPSVEEQAVLVARAFQTAPAMVEFAWADKEEYLTDDVKGILRQRRSAVMPGEEDEETEEETPRKKKKARRDPTEPEPEEPDDDDEDEDEDDVVPGDDDDDNFGDDDDEDEDEAEDEPDEDESDDEESDDEESDEEESDEEESDDEPDFDPDEDEEEDEEEDEDLDSGGHFDDDEDEEDEDSVEEDEDEPEATEDDESEEESEEESESDDDEEEEDEPDDEPDAKEKAKQSKLRKSMDAAKKRGGKRASKEKSDAPKKKGKKKGKAKSEPEAPKKKTKKKKGKAKSEPEAPKKKGKKKGKAKSKSEPEPEAPKKKTKKKKGKKTAKKAKRSK